MIMKATRAAGEYLQKGIEALRNKWPPKPDGIVTDTEETQVLRLEAKAEEQQRILELGEQFEELTKIKGWHSFVGMLDGLHRGTLAQIQRTDPTKATEIARLQGWAQAVEMILDVGPAHIRSANSARDRLAKFREMTEENEENGE